MNRKILHKMIEHCFLQYNHVRDSIPLSAEEYDELSARITEEKKKQPDSEIHELVEDVVYEYLTQ
ncbi:YqzH family protein [Falsibacillus pallidus]|uniref:YqzH family protein n=1 Tax=Falsibacillus pallidus TaxID=493781 RepID=UPI003D953982